MKIKNILIRLWSYIAFATAIIFLIISSNWVFTILSGITALYILCGIDIKCNAEQSKNAENNIYH